MVLASLGEVCRHAPSLSESIVMEQLLISGRVCPKHHILTALPEHIWMAVLVAPLTLVGAVTGRYRLVGTGQLCQDGTLW